MDSLFQYLLENQFEQEFMVKLEGRLANADPFVCKLISGQEYNNYVNLCLKQDKKGESKMDVGQFNNLILKNHVITPNFKNADNISKAGCATTEQLINKVLKGGEQSQLVNRILTESGFGAAVDQEEIDEIKNS